MFAGFPGIAGLEQAAADALECERVLVPVAELRGEFQRGPVAGRGLLRPVLREQRPAGLVERPGVQAPLVFGNGRWSIDLGLAAVLSPAGVPVPSLYPPRTWR